MSVNLCPRNCIWVKRLPFDYFPQAAFGKRTFVLLEFSRRRDWFAVGNSRLGDFFIAEKFMLVWNKIVEIDTATELKTYFAQVMSIIQKKQNCKKSKKNAM